MAARRVTPEAAPTSVDHADQLLDRITTLIEALADRVVVLERRASLRVLPGGQPSRTPTRPAPGGAA